MAHGRSILTQKRKGFNMSVFYNLEKLATRKLTTSSFRITEDKYGGQYVALRSFADDEVVAAG